MPIGANDDGQSNAIQIIGRASSDADVLGMGYALEQQAQAAPLSEFAGRTVTGTLTEGVTTVQLRARLPVGTHLVTASYAGPSTVAAGKAITRLRVNRARPVVRGCCRGRP